ncbi:NTPase KAP family P-loop domain-containing protein 1-like [Anolis sagrei]|uniref:NTPase KAP family P-loop domain-containing protein 1-like n=1 Tax=Anolis sagrei TaxID=38937 RepID=UPI00351FAE67
MYGIEFCLYNVGNRFEFPKVYMKGNEQEGHRTNGELTFWELVTVTFRMIFYNPVLLPTSDRKQKSRVHNIFIHFSAWEYAGTDHIWAGLMTTLCDRIEKHFGRVPMSVYRTVGRKDDNTTESNTNRKWISKKYLGLPLWVATFLICGVAVGLVFLLCLYGFPVGDSIALVEIITGIGLGATAFPATMKSFEWVWNMVFNQKTKLEKQMNRTDVSAQLGFMGEVKKEVKTIIRYLQFMETFQDRKLRVVLKITSLDRCSPEKVMAVLEAMNILLSDCKSPFIPILVADLNVIVECVDHSNYMNKIADNGYVYLNRIITLPFNFPQTDEGNKTMLLQKMIRVKHEKMLADDKELKEDDEKNRAKALSESEPCGCCKSSDQKLCGRSGDDCQVPLVVSSPSKKKEEEEEEKEEVNLIHEALLYLENENMKKYVSSNKLQMERIINTIVVMARLIVKKYYPRKVCPQKVTSWVVLANQWPCRLSWILQCIEDDKQKRVFSKEQERKDTTLLKVYETNMKEFDVSKDEVKKLLELDGDPEDFQNFLDREFKEKDSTISFEMRPQFLVEDVEFFLPCTVNLDSSLKRHMELGRGSRNLNRTKNTEGLSKSISAPDIDQNSSGNVTK